MQRRKALQAIVFFSLSANAIISCKSKSEVVAKLGLKNISIDDDTFSLIDGVTKTIFPTENVEMFKDHTPGPFVIQMVDGLYTKENRDKYLAGLKAFQDLSKSSYKKSFAELTKEEKLALVKQLNDSKESNDVKYFYDITKKQTVTYYTKTENFLRGVQKYEMAPGRWTACLNIDQIQSKKL